MCAQQRVGQRPAAHLPACVECIRQGGEVELLYLVVEQDVTAGRVVAGHRFRNHLQIRDALDAAVPPREGELIGTASVQYQISTAPGERKIAVLDAATERNSIVGSLGR